MRRPGLAADPLWYKDAVVYELHVRAFFDSNNDGIGDFPGLTQKLDYLQDLGVTCLWLLPFFPSPLKDDGYDIADYLNIHPMYGTMEDFKTFLAAAHDRGLQVMIELVMNHTSGGKGDARTRLLRLERERSEIRRRPNYFHRYGKVKLDVGSRGSGLFLASIFFAPARSEL
jgi:1,4-alpha-glucan branching enzyme